MKRFAVGQKIICTHPTGMWLGIFAGPYNNDVVTVSSYSSIHPGCIELCEYPKSRAGRSLPECFAECWFEPAIKSESLLSEPESILIEVSIYE